MNPLTRLLEALRRSTLDRELDDELRGHRDMLIDETLLFDVKASDAPSYGLAAAALLAVALAASLVAGRRATAIDPTQALRYE